jgi:CubicO group peptidase (beta-lactamase class C family)
MAGNSGFAELDQAMDRAVADGVFPAGVLLCARRESIFYYRAAGRLGQTEPAGLDAVFDLASLTKPLATALAVADLIQRGRIRLETPLGQILHETRDTNKAVITIDMLLRHTSGLAAHRAYYKQVQTPGRALGRPMIRQMLIDEPLEARPGGRECYSDLGYMMLAWVAERLSGCDLDRYVTDRIYRPLAIERLGFIPLDAPVPDWCRQAAPTMDCPWRNRGIRAEVEDENAWAAGGVDGHAGLFGTATAVHRLCREIMSALNGSGARVLAPGVMKNFIRRDPGRIRVAGFDTPSGNEPAAGIQAPKTTIGHLGFTGTSFWMDPASGLISILLTNRVHPVRENLLIRTFRPLIHDLVFEAFKRIKPL